MILIFWFPSYFIPTTIGKSALDYCIALRITHCAMTLCHDPVTWPCDMTLWQPCDMTLWHDPVTRFCDMMTLWHRWANRIIMAWCHSTIICTPLSHHSFGFRYILWSVCYHSLRFVRDSHYRVSSLYEFCIHWNLYFWDRSSIVLWIAFMLLTVRPSVNAVW